MKTKLVRARGSRPLLEALEEQVLYSADALGGLDAALVANKDDTVLEASLLPTSNVAEEAGSQQTTASAEYQQFVRHEVVLVDTDTPDYQQFVDDLTSQSSDDRQIDVFILDNTRNGVAQISEVLAGYDNLDAVHIISHGTDGSIDVGGSLLDADALNASAAEIGSWADAFTESGDFLIYGCDLAATVEGQAFVDRLANLTGADVAASDDLTGSASLGGDWDLEYASGSVETSLAISTAAQSGFEAVLTNATFQQGTDGYTGTHDTFVGENSPDTDQGSQIEIEVDVDDGAADGTTQGLIRFDDLFGTGPGQIPFGSTIDSASLTINVTNVSNSAAQVSLHQMLMSWNESSTWNTTASGVQTDNAEAAVASDSVLGNPDVLGPQTFLGLESTLQAWSDGGVNNGWVIVTDNDNGLDFSSSEDGTVSDRPVLTVSYTVPENSGTAIWRDPSTTPQTSDWDGTSFGTTNATAPVGDYRIMQGAEAPTRDEIIIIGVDESSEINGEMWDGSSWTALPSGTLGSPLGTVSQNYWWSMDVAYEQQSGDAVMVWANGSELMSSVWDGTSWTTPITVQDFGATDPRQMQLAAQPGGDELVMVVSDSSGKDTAWVWDGSSWGSQQTLDTSGGDLTSVYVAYEQQSGSAMVTYGKDSDANGYFRIWDGSSWSTEASITPPAGVTDTANWMTLASDPASDQIALGVVTNGGTGADIWLSMWDGTSWDTAVLAETTATGSVSPNVAVAFESTSGQAIAVYGENGSSSIKYSAWNSGSGWSAEQTGPDVGGIPNSVMLASDPLSDNIMLSVQDSNSDVNYVLWNGSSWGTPTELETDTTETKNQPFLFLWDQAGNLPSVVNPTADLWMTTEEDVASPSGANGLDSWTGGSILSFDDPNLTFDPSGTDGTLNNVLNLDSFVQDGDSRLDATHYVGTNMTVGTNAIPLQAGDILLSTVFNETLVNSDASTLSVTSRDVFIFRPDSLTDYSLGGTFIKLIDGADLSVEIEGITLVEQTTTVGSGGGATTLDPGDFLFTDRDNASVIYRLQPGVLGDAATNTGTISVLVDGTDIGINQLIHGVELVETDVVVGDRTLTSGQLLVSLYADDVVAGSSVSRSDIFILNVTDTGSTTTATAEEFFTGGDIGFDTWQESPWAVSLVPTVTTTQNAPTASNNTVTTDEDTPYVFSAADFQFADVDVGDSLQQVQITRLEAVGELKLDGIDVTLGQVITRADIDAGNLTFTPAGDQSGSGYDSFDFKVSDGTSAVATGTVLNSFAAGPVVNSMSSLAFDGTSLWLTSPNTDTLYNFDTAGNLLNSFAAPGTYPTGITFDGTNLWVVDRDDNMVYEIDTLGNVQSSFATPGTDSRGLTWDGSSLWLVEGNGSLIYELSTTGTVLSSFGWPDDYMRDITWDGSSLWVADSNDQQIIELNTSGTVLSSFASPSTGATGFTFDGSEFWHADADTDLIYQLASTSSVTYSVSAYTMTIDVTAVDDPASVTGDISYSGNEGDAVFGDLNATDVEGLTDGTVYSVTSPATNGSAAIDPSSGAWSFTPTDANWFGTDSFTVTVTDDLGGTTEQVVSITLANVSDAPLNMVPGSQTADEDSTLLFSATNGNLISVGDPDSATSPLQVTLTATNGTITLNQTVGLSFSVGTGSGDALMTFTGTTDNINAALDGLGFLSDLDYNGPANIEIQTSDLGSAISGIDTVLGSSTIAGDHDKEQIGTQINIGESGTLTSFSAYLYIDKTEDIRVGLYTDVAGEPGTLIVESNLIAVAPGTNWYTVEVPATAVTAGTYWLSMDVGKEGAFFYDAAGGQTRYSNYDPNGGLAATWSGTYESNSQRISAFANVTPDTATPESDIDNISILINPVDDAAFITGDLGFTGYEGDAVGGDLDATDVEGLTDATYFTVSTSPTNGAAVIDAETGAWSFTPTDANWFGTDSFTVTVTDDLGGATDQIINITLASANPSLLFSTTSDVAASGSPGLDSWASGEALELADPNLTLGDTSNGTLGSVFDFSALGDGNVNLNALHFVTQNLVIGSTNSVSLQYGDVLFTTELTEVIGGVTFTEEHIGLFRPTTAGDYSAGTFSILLDSPYGKPITGFTLIESDTTVGDANLSAGEFLLLLGDATGQKNVWHYSADDVGVGTTTGTSSLLIDGGDIGIDEELWGIELVETTTTVGGVTLNSGSILLTTNATDTIGAVVAESQDIFYLSVTQTTMVGGTSVATATMLLDGSDINLDSAGENIDALAFYSAYVADNPATITGDVSYAGNEGDAVSGDMDATDVEGLTDGTVFSVTSPATNGTAAIDPATGVWSFTPTDSNWFGTDNFTVTVTDDLGGTTTQVVSITLANIDDNAVITGDVGFSGNEGDAVTGDMDATDVEGLTDGTVFSVTSPAANGTAAIDPASGVWSFTPADSDWFGTDAFTVTVTDDLGGTTTQVVNITLANVDDAAVITGDVSFSGDEGDAVSGDMDASDVEGLTDGTVFSVTSPATNGTAAIDPATGAWSFTPTDSNWFGTDAFTVTVTDDLGGTTTQVVNITLANVDDAAVITGDVSFSGNEGDAVSGDMDATDVEGLTDGTVFSVTSPAANGTAAIDPATGAWSFTPSDSNWFGTDAFTVTVTDDLGGTTTQVVSITLANVDDAAVIYGDVSFNGNEGDAVSGDMDATDVEGLTDGTVFSVTSPATNGTAAIDPATGAWSFTPTDSDWFGTDNFTVTVTDDLGGTTTQVVSITLANIDDDAVITGDVSFSGNEGDAVSGDMDATDVEGLTDGTVFSVTSPAANGTAAIDPATGAWSFTPTDSNWFGTDAFTVTVTDDLGGTTTQVVSITLANVDDAAVISGDISFNGNEGDAVSGDMDATDVEGLTDGTVFSVTSPATNGTAAIDPATGAWSFTPTDSNWFGTDNFTVTVTDDLGGTTTQVVSITLANIDDDAVITGDVSFSGNEGDAVSGDMDATDVEGLTDGTVFSVTSPAANGTAAIDPATGAWSFTPTDSDWFGTDAFTVTVTDDLGGTTTQVVNITLANVDDAAVISGDISFNGNEGDAVSGDMDASDVEGLTDGTVFSVTSPAANGTAAIDPATGVWSFTPTDSNWFGTDNFTVTVTDDLGGTTTQVVSITLANIDDDAVITGDVSFSGNEGDVVSGDMDATDVEGLTDGTVFSVTSPATNGTAAINPATGAWSFTPTDSDWFGTDSFTVTVTDDLGGTTTQVVNITLANVDDAAVITGDVSFSGNEGDAVSGDMDATDVEGLTDGTVFSVTSPAANGTAAIDPATGAWSFTPTDSNWFGTDAFTVTVTDDLGGTTTQVVSITLANVDDAAVIYGDVSFNGNEGDAVSGDMDASDVEGLTDGTVFSVTSPAANGTAAIDPATGVWSFTPTDSNWFGTDNFTVTVTDDLGGTTTQVVSITLANIDDDAVITGDVSFSGNEGDVVSGDMDATDVEGLTDGTVFSVTSPATNGTAAINPATGAWSFTPTDSDWFGTDSFTVTVTDDLGGTTTQVVNITLANVDDAAVITGDVSFSGNEGDAVSGDMDATDVEGLTDGTVFSVTSPAVNGTAAINPATGAWTFTPTDANWFGTDAFTVTVTDDLGGATTQVVNITLANVDDAAVITGDVSFSGNEGDVVSGDMDATDVEGLTDGTVFSVTSPAANGTATIDPASGVWSFTPTDSNWFGTDSFEVTVTDDLGGTTTQVVNITLANVDDAAVITGDVSFSGNEGDVVSGDMDATDVEGLTDGTVFSVTSPVANGTATIDPASGVWSFTPTDSNWFGTDSFEVTVTDDLGGTTTQVVSITLANVDDAAVISGDVSFNGNEGDAVSGDLDATDVEGLTDGTVFSVTSPAVNGTAAIDPATGAWSFTPTDANWFGTDAFTVTVTDDLGGTTTQVVNITLANVDDAAIITGDVSFSGNEGDAVSGDMDATDVEGLTDGTVFSVTSPAASGTAAIDPATGAWSFTPADADWFGTDAFTVTVADDLGGITTQVVSITLANVDDAAVITGDVSFSGNEGDAVSGDMDATDVEGLTDGTVFSVTSPATNGTAAIDPATGAWSFTPTDSNWFGTDAFTVTVTDDLGGTTEQLVSITLANVDDAAVITGDVSFSGNEGDVVSGNIDATDVEGLTDGTVFSVTAPATNGTASIDPATGAWTFTPADADWFGTDSFEVTVTDDLGGTTTQVVSITLANVDDAAVITGDVSFSGNEGDVISGDMDATDVEGLTDGTVFTVTSPAANGTAAIDPATGAWSFTPTDVNWCGTDSFTVTVTDDLGGTSTQVVNITLANIDDPAIVGGTRTGAVTEDAGVINGNLRTSGSLTIADPDAGESAFQAASSVGTYGVLASDTAGNWTYVADNSVAAIQALDAGESVVDRLTVTTAGGTTQDVLITITGAEDAPVINGSQTGVAVRGDVATSQGTLSIHDPDTSDNPLGFSDVGPTPGDNGFGQFELSAGTWTYTLNNAHDSVRSLEVGETLLDTIAFTASDGSTEVVSITIEAAQSDAILIGDADSTVFVDQKPDEYEWLSDILAVVSNPADDGEPETVIDDDVPVLVETSDTDNAGIVESSAIFADPLQVQTLGPGEAQVRELAPPPDRRDGTRVSAVAEPASLVRAQVMETGTETSAIETSAEIPLIEQLANQEALRHATQAMRDEMSDAKDDGRMAERMADIGLRVSGTALSTGSLAWLLRSASLFASALSSIPTWRGFDPLPVLTRSKRSKNKREKEMDETQREEDEREAAVGRVLDAADDPNERKTPVSRKKETT